MNPFDHRYLHVDKKWKNNRIEGDHAALKRLFRLGKGFKTMRSAKATIQAIEAHRIIKNNHIRNIQPSVKGEIDFVLNLFKDAA